MNTPAPEKVGWIYTNWLHLPHPHSLNELQTRLPVFYNHSTTIFFLLHPATRLQLAISVETKATNSILSGTVFVSKETKQLKSIPAASSPRRFKDMKNNIQAFV